MAGLMQLDRVLIVNQQFFEDVDLRAFAVLDTALYGNRAIL